MTPLFAIDESLIKLIFFGVVGLIYLLNHLLGGRKESTQKRQREERRKTTELKPLRPTSAQTVAQRREVEEYQRSRQKEQRRPAIPPARPAKQAPAKQATAKKQPRRLSESPVDAQIVDSVASHVAKHLENQTFDQRAAHMTDDLSKADREREEHLRKTFDHNVGRLPQAASAEPRMTDTAAAVQHAAGSPGAELLVTMLSNPSNLRHAIVLNEILHRPAERW